MIAMGILAVLFGGMTWLMNFYMDQVKPELEAKKALTAEFAKEIAADSEIRLLRLADAPKGIYEAGKQMGLNIEARPSDASWKADATGGALAARIATAASRRYGPERPIQWLKVTLSRSDGRSSGAGEVVFGFRVGDNREVDQVSRVESPAPR